MIVALASEINQKIFRSSDVRRKGSLNAQNRRDILHCKKSVNYVSTLISIYL